MRSAFDTSIPLVESFPRKSIYRIYMYEGRSMCCCLEGVVDADEYDQKKHVCNGIQCHEDGVCADARDMYVQFGDDDYS